jgi:hypothetical protein
MSSSGLRQAQKYPQLGSLYQVVGGEAHWHAIAMKRRTSTAIPEPTNKTERDEHTDVAGINDNRRHRARSQDERDDRLTAAEAYLAQLRQAALIAEAQDLARGVRHLSVVTGELETGDDVARIDQLTAAAWQGRDGAGTGTLVSVGDLQGWAG